MPLGIKPYSKNLRLRVLAAVDSGIPKEEVAKTFSVPTIERFISRVAAKPVM